MNSKIKKYFFSAVFAFVFIMAPEAILAAENIDTDLPAGSLISESNIMPGDSFSRKITVTKLNDAEQKLLINFKSDNSQEQGLSEKILVKIKKVSDGQFVNLPNGKSDQSLKELFDYQNENSGAFELDLVLGTANSKFEYELQFTFDPATGNEYQGKKTTFDILVGIESIENKGEISEKDDNKDDDDNGDDDGNDPIVQSLIASGINSNIPPLPNSEISPEAEQTQREVQGEEVVQDDDGEVAGDAAETCNPFPKLWFILALIAYILILHYILKRLFLKKLFIKIITAAAITAGALAFWYFCDICRTNLWFIYTIPILGLILFIAKIKFNSRK